MFFYLSFADAPVRFIFQNGWGTPIRTGTRIINPDRFKGDGASITQCPNKNNDYFYF